MIEALTIACLLGTPVPSDLGPGNLGEDIGCIHQRVSIQESSKTPCMVKAAPSILFWIDGANMNASETGKVYITRYSFCTMRP